MTRGLLGEAAHDRKAEVMGNTAAKAMAQRLDTVAEKTVLFGCPSGCCV